MQKGNNNMKHKHSDKDVIIRDHDGTFKILVDGKFVPLSEAESAAHAAEHEANQKPEPKKKPAPIVKKQKGGFKDDALTQKAKTAIKKSGVTFASQELETRAIKALIPQIKGVRKSFETKETLMKAVADGGVGMQSQEVERIMTALGGAKPSERKPKMDVALTKSPKAPLKKVAGEVAHDVKPPQKIAAVAPGKPKPKVDQSSAPKQMASKPVHAPKPALRDVNKQIPSAAIGPIQELSYKLIDWRRLGENPVDRVKKIESKLDVLEQDSYADRLAGVQAWHESEVVMLYEQVGLKSLEQNLTVEQLLGQGGPEKLSFAEWRAIADLDERIRA